MPFQITDDDRTAFRAMPFQQTCTCSCGKQATCAGPRRRNKLCLECFARRRHRRMGQLRARAAQQTIGGF